jgi:hypothetical protein
VTITITRASIRARARQALERYFPAVPILEGQRWPVFAPQTDQPQALLLLSYGDIDMRARGASGAPCYNVAMPVTVRARVALAPNPATPPGRSAHGEAVEAAADAWALGLREALLGDPDFCPIVADGPARVEFQVPQDPGAGEQLIFEAALTIEARWVEEYPPRLPDNLTTFNLRLDAIEPADKLGTYAPAPPFPNAAAAPRAAGPDGRAEAGFTETLPNP